MSTWPQWVYLGLLVLALGIDLERNGQPKTGKHSFFGSLLGVSISGFVLWKGGFFAPLGW